VTTYYKAVFPDGRVETRSTTSRTYAGCVILAYTVRDYRDRTGKETRECEEVTWAGTVGRARAVAASGPGKWKLSQSGRWAPAEEITAAEYRQLRK
jgi:hypothetical protein